MPSEAKFAELSELLAMLFDGELARSQRQRLEALLLDDPNAQDFYWQLFALDSELEWHLTDCPPCLSFELAAKEEVEARAPGLGASEATAMANGGMILENRPGAATPGGPPPVQPSAFIPNLSPLLGSPRLAYAAATLILGAGLLVGWVWDRTGSRSIAREGLPPAVADGRPQAAVIGKITGLSNCCWTDPHAAAVVGDDVPKGREYRLKSGQLEITCSAGTRLTLKGPAVYLAVSEYFGSLGYGELMVDAENRRGTTPFFIVARSVILRASDDHSQFAVTVDARGHMSAYCLQGHVAMNPAIGTVIRQVPRFDLPKLLEQGTVAGDKSARQGEEKEKKGRFPNS
jgi:hypothetical protein